MIFNQVGNISPKNKDIGVAYVPKASLIPWLKISENSEFEFSF